MLISHRQWDLFSRLTVTSHSDVAIIHIIICTQGLPSLQQWRMQS